MSVEQLMKRPTVCGPPGTEELDRLRRLVVHMVQDQAADLVKLLHQVRLSTNDTPPLAAAFACLAVAELRLLESGIALNEPSFRMFRKFAVDIAEHIAAAGVR